MNRRAKLSLASSQDSPKKQAPPGFESIETPSETASAQADPSPQPPPRPPGWETDAKRKAGVTAGTGSSTPPLVFRPRQLLKVAVVLVATALSLYLLKRRFF